MDTEKTLNKSETREFVRKFIHTTFEASRPIAGQVENNEFDALILEVEKAYDSEGKITEERLRQFCRNWKKVYDEENSEIYTKRIKSAFIRTAEEYIDNILNEL
jgi:hypothetical protein